MLSLLLITALAVQNPPAASKPTTRAATPRDTSSASRAAPVSRTAFQNTMRKLWTDHVVYTRGFIVAASAGTPDTAAVLQRLLRNQDEIGDAVKPYYGDEAGTKLATLLREHIALAGRALMAVKGSQHAMADGMHRDSAGYMAPPLRNDTTKMRSTDTTMNRSMQMPRNGRTQTDTTKARTNANPAYPATATASRTTDSTKARTDSTAMSNSQWSAAQAVSDSQSQTAAIAALRANADSIAAFLSGANARNWPRATLQGALQMHLNLLLQEATAQIKGDWQGSVAAFDASLDQALQMADMLSDGVIKQFPSRFSNKSTTMSSLQ